MSVTIQDVKEEYAEMREEFLAGLEDRRYVPIAEARAKRLQVRTPLVLCDRPQMDVAAGCNRAHTAAPE